MTNYGRDTDCLDSLRTGRYVSGVRLVAQAVYRRLITERFSLRGGEDEANYGLALTSLIGQRVGSAASWEGRIRGEVLKDPRVRDADVAIVRTVDGPSETWSVTVSGVTDEGPFALVMSVSDVTTQLVGLST